MNTLQIIWDCLDIPNKETVEFVSFRLDYDRVLRRFYRNKETREIVLEGEVGELQLQKILKHLPNAGIFQIKRLGEASRYYEFQWNEETQKMQILPEYNW